MELVSTSRVYFWYSSTNSRISDTISTKQRGAIALNGLIGETSGINIIPAVKRKYALLILRNWKRRLTGRNENHEYLRVEIAFPHKSMFSVPVVTVRAPAIVIRNSGCVE